MRGKKSTCCCRFCCLHDKPAASCSLLRQEGSTGVCKQCVAASWGFRCRQGLDRGLGAISGRVHCKTA